MKIAFTIVSALLMCSMGCAHSRQAATAAVDPATTQPSYWMEQPPIAVIESADFDKLWSACEDSARDFLFKIERTDYRAGMLTTAPLVSGQWFEPWRRDNRTPYDVLESSLVAIRRTLRFEFTRRPDNTWQAVPKILVERQNIAEQRITAVVLYRRSVAGPGRESGTRERDQGISIPGRYWYPLRRDTEFERAIGQLVDKKLHNRW